MSDEIAIEKKTTEPGLLDLLLRSDAPDMLRQLPEKSFEVKRLSKIAGKPAVFRLRGLPYGRVQEMRRLEEDVEVHIILAGCLEPDLRSPALMERYKAPTPAEAVKCLAMLLECPGVDEYTAFTLNGGAASVPTTAEQTPVVGTITITEGA